MQPSKATACHSQGLINEVIRNRSPQFVTHIPHMWDLSLAQHRHWDQCHVNESKVPVLFDNCNFPPLHETKRNDPATFDFRH